MRRARLRFWFAMHDLAVALRAPLPVYLWIVGRMSDATDWSEDIARAAEAPEGDDPF